MKKWYIAKPDKRTKSGLTFLYNSNLHTFTPAICAIHEDFNSKEEAQQMIDILKMHKASFIRKLYTNCIPYEQPC